MIAELQQVKDLISKGWVQGTAAYSTTEGMDTDPHSIRADCWCLTGAIDRVCGSPRSMQSNDMVEVVLAQVDHLQASEHDICPRYTLQNWNDNPCRTKSEVLAVLDKAIKEAS